MKKSCVVTMIAVMLVGMTGIENVSAVDSAQSSELTTETNLPSTEAKVIFKDIQGHWAETSINNVYEKGYISVPLNQKFNPNQQITRAEFLKMVVIATELQVGPLTNESPWYQPYVTAATIAGIYNKDDFGSEQWPKTMTRKDMARLSMRAIGETAENDDEFIYLAVQKGLMGGTGAGNLDTNGTTTRAQAVTIIERLLEIKEGKQLPVDEQALVAAEQAKNAPKDMWGRKIRTTNLPKNYSKYPYILEELPNEMYELSFSPIAGSSSQVNATKALFAKYPEFTKENIDIWMQHATNYYDQILNVNYKTITYDWSKKVNEETITKDDYSLTILNKYVDRVKKNKVIIEGSLVPEPTIMYNGAGGSYFVRSKVKFIVRHANSMEGVFFDPIYDAKYDKFKVGIWYEGYADIQIATNVGGSWGDSLRVYGLSSLFTKPAIYREVK